MLKLKKVAIINSKNRQGLHRPGSTDFDLDFDLESFDWWNFAIIKNSEDDILKISVQN